MEWKRRLLDNRYLTLGWMENNEESALYSKEKHLITQETRDYIYSTISGFISLCKLRLGKGHGIKPGFINSDIVENLFGQHRGIRNGLNDNPTLSQYGPSTTAIILGQCSVSSKCNSGNTQLQLHVLWTLLNTPRNKCNKKKRRTLRIWFKFWERKRRFRINFRQKVWKLLFIY